MEDLSLDFSKKSFVLDNFQTKKEGSFSSGIFMNNFNNEKKRNINHIMINKSGNNQKQAKETKFKKIFSQSGKFTQIARIKFGATKLKKIEKEKENHTYKLGTKINKEVFDETYLSEDDVNYTKPIRINLCNNKTAFFILLMCCFSSHSFIEGLMLGSLKKISSFYFLFWAVLLRRIVETSSIVRIINHI